MRVKPLYWLEEELDGRMTKKHYVLLASIIQAHTAAERLAGSDCGAERRMLGELLKTLVKTNPRFDSRRFIEACGL